MDTNNNVHYYETSLSAALKDGDKVEQAKAYENLGQTFASQGKYHEAFAHYEKLLNIALEIGNKTWEGIAYANLGNACHMFGRYTEGIEWQEKGMRIALELSDRELEGGAYGSLGNCHESLGQYEKAIEYYEKHLKNSLEIENRKGQAVAYSNLGNAYLQLARYDRAILCQETSLRIAIEIADNQLEGVVYGKLGIVYKQLAKYTRAIECHQKHLDIALENEDRHGEEIAYGNLGISYHSLGNHHKALEYFQKELRTALDIGDRVGEGNAYTMVGAAYDSLGKYSEAIENFEKHLNIALELGDRKGEGNAHGNLGNVYESLGMLNKAMECQEKRLKIATEIADKVGEQQTYSNMGNLLNLMGRYYDAIKYFNKYLEFQIEMGHKSEEAKAYGNLGNSYSALGEFEKAIQYHQKRLEITLEIGDRDGEGQTYGNIGIAFNHLRKFKEAIEYHSKCLNIAKEIGDRNSEGKAYGSLGCAYCSLGKYQESIEFQENCLAIAVELGDKIGEAASYGNLGVVYKSLQGYHKALECHEKDLKLCSEVGEKRGEASAHFSIGQLYYTLGVVSRQKQDQDDATSHMKQAEHHLKESLQCYERLFDDLQEQDQFKVSLLERFHKVYKLLTIVCLENQDPVGGLLVSERGRARALGDLLHMKYGVQEQINASSPFSLSDLESVFLNSKVTVVFYAQIESNRAIWILSGNRLLFSLQSGLPGKDQDISDLVKHSYDRIGVRAAANCEDRSIGAVLDDDDVLEEVAGESSQIVEGNTLKGATDTTLRNIYLLDGELEDEEGNPLELLYDLLVTPVENAFGEDEILIIPDGPMFSVPFASLKDPKTGRFLSETKRIRLAPSLSTLQTIQDSSEEFHCKSGALIVGDPEIGKVMFRGKERSFHPLPGARKEAERIGEILNVKPITGSEATKETILQKLGEGVSVIHFAAHGSEKGQILLAPTTSASAEGSIPDEKDFVLTTHEAQQHGIRAQLVVLSCCHSGRGEVKAEGLMGLSRAFLAAGAQAVVASLWAIDDQATLDFMCSFYSHLKSGKSASTSLHQGMKELRESESRYNEPMYWSPFFLIGDDVTLKF